MSNAAIVSHTPINAFMDMTIFRFQEFYSAISAVMRRMKEGS